MFWRKHDNEETMVAEKSFKEVAKVAPIKTADVVREYIESQKSMIYPENYIKVHEFMNDEKYKMMFTEREKTKLRDLGFSIFVKAKWVGKFNYHACVWIVEKGTSCINTIYNKSNPTKYPTFGNRVQYSGDIPMGVLEKAKLVRDTRILHSITIHSMSPFPMEFIKCDPLLIGWTYCPQILVDDNGKYGDMVNSNAEGVIIAMWDYDKEVSLL